MANRWVGFQLDMISTALLGLTVLLGVLLRSDVDAGLIGLAIAYAIQLSGTFQRGAGLLLFWPPRESVIKC
jgi:ATP-binding cassette subfamily C (CFTR/MRP) protein 4